MSKELYKTRLEELRKNSAKSTPTPIPTRILLGFLVDHYNLRRRGVSIALGKTPQFIDSCNHAYQQQWTTTGFKEDTAEKIAALFEAPHNNPEFWTANPVILHSMDELPKLDLAKLDSDLINTKGHGEGTTYDLQTGRLKWKEPLADASAAFSAAHGKTSPSTQNDMQNLRQQYNRWIENLESGKEQTISTHMFLAFTLLANGISPGHFAKGELGKTPAYFNATAFRTNKGAANGNPVASNGFDRSDAEKICTYFDGDFATPEFWQRRTFTPANIKDIPQIKLTAEKRKELAARYQGHAALCNANEAPANSSPETQAVSEAPQTAPETTTTPPPSTQTNEHQQQGTINTTWRPIKLAYCLTK